VRREEGVRSEEGGGRREEAEGEEERRRERVRKYHQNLPRSSKLGNSLHPNFGNHKWKNENPKRASTCLLAACGIYDFRLANLVHVSVSKKNYAGEDRATKIERESRSKQNLAGKESPKKNRARGKDGAKKDNPSTCPPFFLKRYLISYLLRKYRNSEKRDLLPING
jgi:hypothetical protein